MSSSLSPLDGPKLGGLEAVYFVDARRLLELPDARGLLLLGDLVLAPGEQWAALPGRIYTQAVDVDAAPGPHGPNYAQELSGFYGGDVARAAAYFAQLQGRRFAVLYRDYQGQVRLIGEPGVGLQFSYKQSSQRKPGESAGYTWSFKGVTPAPARFYTGAFAVAGQAHQPATVGGPVSLYDRAGNVMATALPGQKMILTSAFRATIAVEPV